MSGQTATTEDAPGIEIAVVGSANLDLVVEVDSIPSVGETVLGGDVHRVPGGKGANQAVASSRLGRRVAIVGRVGDDDAGSVLRAALENSGVDTSQLRETVGVPSGLAMISVGSDGDNSIVVSPGANARVTPADVTAAQPLLQAAPVTLLQLEIPVEAVVAAAKAAHGTVILNPAPATALPSDLLDHVDIAVPNQTELALLAGGSEPADVATAAEMATSLPTDAVVVTLGADGALVVENGRATHVPAPKVDPVDTTAAGDSFCAALADGLVRGLDLESSTLWAVRVGAATTQRKGAQPSLPTAEEVEALIGS